MSFEAGKVLFSFKVVGIQNRLVRVCVKAFLFLQ